MEPAAASGVRGEGGSQSTEAYSPRTKRLREVLLGGTSAKRPSPSAECVFNPSSAEELQDVQSTSTDEERLSPVEGGDVNYSPDELAHYQSWMDASWRASEGQTSGRADAAAATIRQDAGLQAAAAREDGGEEEDDLDEGEGEWEGEWGGAWEGCDDVYAGSLGVAGARVGVGRSDKEEEAEEVGEDGQVKVAGVATAAAAGLLRATARAARLAVALPSVSRVALETLDEETRLHMTRLLQLHNLTQAAGNAAVSKGGLARSNPCGHAPLLMPSLWIVAALRVLGERRGPSALRDDPGLQRRRSGACPPSQASARLSHPGSGLTREELHRLLSCLPSFEEGGAGGGGCDGGGDGGGDGGCRSGGDGAAQEHAQAGRLRNAAHRES